jgi:hypothetical protein
MPQSADPSSGCVVLLQSTSAGTERVLELQPATPMAIAALFQAANDDPQQTGIKAVSTWPDDICALAARLYAAGIAAHHLPGKLHLFSKTIPKRHQTWQAATTHFNIFLVANFFFAIQLDRPQYFASLHQGFAVVAKWLERCAL